MVKGHAGLGRDRAGEHGLAGAWRAKEQDAARHTCAQRAEVLRVAQELDRLGQLELGLLATGDVLQPDVVGRRRHHGDGVLGCRRGLGRTARHDRGEALSAAQLEQTRRAHAQEQHRQQPDHHRQEADVEGVAHGVPGAGLAGCASVDRRPRLRCQQVAIAKCDQRCRRVNRVRREVDGGELARVRSGDQAWLVLGIARDGDRDHLAVVDLRLQLTEGPAHVVVGGGRKRDRRIRRRAKEEGTEYDTDTRDGQGARQPQPSMARNVALEPEEQSAHLPHQCRLTRDRGDCKARAPPGPV
jgi:hypothetical protein